MRIKKLSLILSLPILSLIVPSLVMAAEPERTVFHVFYESSFGPIGVIAGIIAMVIFWQIAKKVEANFGYALKMFVLVLLFINIGSFAFGIHGVGLLDGETTRYIERIFRLVALLVADVAALTLYARMNKKSEKN